MARREWHKVDLCLILVTILKKLSCICKPDPCIREPDPGLKDTNRMPEKDHKLRNQNIILDDPKGLLSIIPTCEFILSGF